MEPIWTPLKSSIGTRTMTLPKNTVKIACRQLIPPAIIALASMYVGNVLLLLLNLPLVGLWVQFLRIPYRVLFPIVLLLSIVGVYSANKNVFDLWVMLGFGVAGYVLSKLKYDLAPFVIAFVLAPLLEQSLRQSLAMSPDGAMIFVQRPGTALMLVSSAILVALMMRRRPKGGSR